MPLDNITMQFGTFANWEEHNPTLRRGASHTPAPLQRIESVGAGAQPKGPNVVSLNQQQMG